MGEESTGLGNNVDGGGSAEIRSDNHSNVNFAAEEINIVDSQVAGRDINVYGLSADEVAALVVKLKHADMPKVWNGHNPYPGLRAFQESDAKYFFGRESLIVQLLAHVARARFVVLSGPSGSGKSSAARAGLLHALRQGKLDGSETWLLATMSPQGDPLRNLALALQRATGAEAIGAKIAGEAGNDPHLLATAIEMYLTDDPRQRCLLLVDQFEEIFTQTKDPVTRQTFIGLLTGAAQPENSRMIIVLSLRSDFVSNCAGYPALRELLSREFQLVGAMEPNDLVKAISLPALEVGAEIEAALVSRIMDDMHGEPGALPLMSFALRDLFEAEQSRSGRPMDLTLQEYLDRGGLEQALQRHADAVFATFSDEQKALARNVFSRLIEVGQGRVDTRRTASFDELIPAGADPAEVSAVVMAMAHKDVRLLTTDRVASDATKDVPESATRTVTIAHEKLIEAWPWLHALVDENRDLIALQNQLSRDAATWAEDNDSGFLYQGGRLLQIEEKLGLLQPNLDELSTRFVEASLAEREHREAEAEANRRKDEELRSQQRVGRILRWATVIVGLLLIVAVVLAFQANSSANVAQSAKATSDANAEVAFIAQVTSDANARAAATSEAQVAQLKTSIQASQLALASGAELQNNQELALLLAAAALGINDQPNSLHSFYGAVYTPFRRSLYGHTDRVWSAVFSPDGTLIVTASEDGSAKLWDVASGAEVASLDGHTDWVNTASFSPDGTLIVTASDDGGAKVWDVASGAAVASLDGHTFGVNSAVFSPDGALIVTASGDGSAKLWDALSGTEVASLEWHNGGVNTATFSPDGALVITASDDGSAKLWDVASGAEVASLDGHTDAVRLGAFSPDGMMIVTTCWDGSAKVWDVASGAELASLDGHTFEVNSAAFSPDGALIVTASSDGSAKVWDVASGREVASLDGHTDAVTSAAFSPDGVLIVTASGDGSAKVWDVSTSEEVASLNGHTDAVLSAAFSPDGALIVTARGDRSAKVWDVANGAAVASLHGHTGSVNTAAFSPDGALVVTASGDGSAKVWDVASGVEVASLDGHTDWVNSAVFSPDGTLVVTASNDESAKVWDVANGLAVASLDGHADEVNSAAFSPDGALIVTASWDGSAKVWSIYPTLESKIAVARERLSRGFTDAECQSFFRDDLASCPRTVDALFALFDDDLAARQP
ncbi:MAG: hypothetical protein M9918_15730 [Anaerolineae bacterium]|nr:hypothetical protein [Anaerolineae bacterium]